MKGSIKMENSDGYLKKFTKQQKTKILPLRWIANLCEKPAHYHLGWALHYSDHDDYGFAYKYHAFLSNWFYKPYFKWGTVYKLDLDDPDIMGKAYDKK